MYADDYNDYFPEAISAIGGNYGYWHGFLRHYLPGVKGSLQNLSLNDLTLNPTPMSMEIRVCALTQSQSFNRTSSIYNNPFLCPATLGINSTTSGGANPYGSITTGSVWSDYTMNFKIGGFAGVYTSTRRANIKRPDITALLADGARVGAFGNASYFYFSPRHSNHSRVNVLLVDGHVESCRWRYGDYWQMDGDLITFVYASTGSDGFGGVYRSYKAYVWP